MSKEWQTGEVITATELNRMETDISGKISEETDPIWVSQRTGILSRLNTVEGVTDEIKVREAMGVSHPPNWYASEHQLGVPVVELKESTDIGLATGYYGYLRTTWLQDYHFMQEYLADDGSVFVRNSQDYSTWETWEEMATKQYTDAWSSWETAHKGTTTDLAIAGTEVDVTAYFGTLAKTTFGSTPIAYNTPNDRFVAGVIGKSYSFVLNLRLSGSLSGSATTTSIFKLIIRRAFDNSLVAFKTFAKDSGAPTTFTGEDMISFITRVYGDTDPFVTGGFKLSLQRVAGNQTLTLNGTQQLFINK